MKIAGRNAFFLHIGIAIGLCCLHALLFHLRWHHNTGATTQQLLISFWIAVIALSFCLRGWKFHRRALLPTLAVGILLLLPGAASCLSWTLWTIMPYVT